MSAEVLSGRSAANIGKSSLSVGRTSLSEGGNLGAFSNISRGGGYKLNTGPIEITSSGASRRGFAVSEKGTFGGNEKTRSTELSVIASGKSKALESTNAQKSSVNSRGAFWELFSAEPNQSGIYDFLSQYTHAYGKKEQSGNAREVKSETQESPPYAEKNNVQTTHKSNLEREVIDATKYTIELTKLYHREQGIPEEEAKMRALDKLHERFQELDISVRNVDDQLSSLETSETELIEGIEGELGLPLYTEKPGPGEEIILETKIGEGIFYGELKQDSPPPPYIQEQMVEESAAQEETKVIEAIKGEPEQYSPPPYKEKQEPGEKVVPEEAKLSEGIQHNRLSYVEEQVVKESAVREKIEVIEDTKVKVELKLEQDSPLPDTEEQVVFKSAVQEKTEVIEDTTGELDLKQDSPLPDAEESEPEEEEPEEKVAFVNDDKTNGRRKDLFVKTLTVQEQDVNCNIAAKLPGQPPLSLISDVLRRRGASNDRSYTEAVAQAVKLPTSGVVFSIKDVGHRIAQIVFVHAPAIAFVKGKVSNQAKPEDVERVIGKQTLTDTRSV
jgi:hypothetical protein